MIVLLSKGLTPNSKVLDIGCGCLRGGYWCIHFLEEGCYFGIEPNISMLVAGKNTILEPHLIELKKPVFDNNDLFDFTVFNEVFDYFIARSIWTHASKLQIQTMLDNFLFTSHENSIFITSYKDATNRQKDYMGTVWKGRSHKSKKGGIVRHRFEWIQDECQKRGLILKKIEDCFSNFGKQDWLENKIRLMNILKHKSIFNPKISGKNDKYI